MGQQRGVSTSPQKHLLRISERTKLLAACVHRASGGDSRSSPSLATERLFSFLKTTVSLKKKKKGKYQNTHSSVGCIASCRTDTNPSHPHPPAPRWVFEGKGLEVLQQGRGSRAPISSNIQHNPANSTGCTSG